VHLGIILFDDQLDTQFLFVYVYFNSLYAHHQEIQLYQYDIWYMPLYVGYRLVCRFGRSVQTSIPDCHLHRVTYNKYRIDTIEFPDDAHLNARNM